MILRSSWTSKYLLTRMLTRDSADGWDGTLVNVDGTWQGSWSSTSITSNPPLTATSSHRCPIQIELGYIKVSKPDLNMNAWEDKWQYKCEYLRFMDDLCADGLRRHHRSPRRRQRGGNQLNCHACHWAATSCKCTYIDKFIKCSSTWIIPTFLCSVALK